MSEIKQFNVSLIANNMLKTHMVNCNNVLSAQFISETLYPNMRIIDITEIKFTNT